MMRIRQHACMCMHVLNVQMLLYIHSIDSPHNVSVCKKLHEELREFPYEQVKCESALLIHIHIGVLLNVWCACSCTQYLQEIT